MCRKKGVLLAGIILAVSLSACQKTDEVRLDASDPVAISVWHAYNAVAKAKFDDLVHTFNETVGAEMGIVVDAKGYSSSDELENAVYESASGSIGSDELPDIFTSYPDAAFRVDQIKPLANLDLYFTEEEWDAYRPEFLETGYWGEEPVHKMVPVAKSTELLYLNKTLWDQFSRETGADKSLLNTWEGLLQAAELYREWSGGMPFLGMNSYSEYISVTAAQMGAELRPDPESGEILYSEETARRAWDAYYVPHIKGLYASDVYNQDGIKSGKLMAVIGSSGGAGFIPKEVIVNEAESYPMECECLPYPYFEGGTDYMVQRGADMAVIASDPVREYAAAEFLKWFTAPEQNLEFSVSTGYFPVQKGAFASDEELLSYAAEGDNPEAIQRGLQTILETMKKRTFYSRKPYSGSYEAERIYSASMEERMRSDLENMVQSAENGESVEDMRNNLLSRENFLDWYDELKTELAGVTNEENK